MEGLWFKECREGRRFIIKIAPGESLVEGLVRFASEAQVHHGVIASAVGSVKNVRLRGIKTGARLPITPPRVNVVELEGPLELLALEGNIFPGEECAIDCHLHIMAARSTGEVVGGHLYDAEVFASCEIVLDEFGVEGVERHLSKSGGIPTIFIEEEK